MRVEEPGRRASLMALAALVTAFAAATATFVVFELDSQTSISGGDSSIWVSVGQWWTSFPLFTVSLTLGGAGAGFMAAVFPLWTTDLAKAIPLIFIVTVLAAALAANADSPQNGIAVSLVCAIGVMVWCRKRFAWRRTHPVNP